MVRLSRSGTDDLDGLMLSFNTYTVCHKNDDTLFSDITLAFLE